MDQFKSFFSVEGPAYQVATWIYYMMAITLCFIVMSIPLITIGASTAAAHGIASRIVRKEEIHNPFSLFIKGFIENWRQGTLAQIVVGGLLIFESFNLYLIFMYNGIYSPFFILNVIIVLEILIIQTMLYPIIVRYKMSFINALKAAMLLGNKHLFTSLLIICVSITASVLTFLYCAPLGIILYGAIVIFNQYFSSLILTKQEKIQSNLTEEKRI